MATAIVNWNVVAAGSETTVLSTEMNSLASGTDSAAGTAYDNTPSTSSLGYTHAIVEFAGTFAATPTDKTSVYLYMLMSLDGTNYPDASSTSALPVTSFTVRNTASAQRVVRTIELPPCKVKFMIKHDAVTALTSSGHTVKIRGANQQIN